MRNETQLMMQPCANWEEYLTPAPPSIAILGELIFISSTTDFSVCKNPPKGGYKFIKYHDSLYACVMQVCNYGWWAFNETHKSMDQIRLHTAKVSDYVESAVKILFQDYDEVVKAHLSNQLENIREIADECLELSDATEKRFTHVINIIQELLEACVTAVHFYGEEMEAVKKKLEESKLREQSALETKKRTEKAVCTMEEELRNCELKKINFKTTIEMLVKGMDAIGRVKEKWEKMVYFFQMVSFIVKTSLSKTLTKFVSTSEKTQALSYNAKLITKDLLYTEAFQACNITSLVHMISGTYTDVSNKYLMDCVSSLRKLMVIDKSKPEIDHERQQLQISCDEAQRGILRLVLKNKKEFDRKSTARLERIDRELLAILPDAPPEQIKRIQEIVQTGFSEEEGASYY
ncbi:hypothetical protein M9458_032769 [Cirrhinus mrigala]|uniref:Uncharacterized protein n=1 Tax=Cirrhinus mrigala TaxID=683832 RepID=A0ABD0PGW0_CIRMR